MRTETWRVEEVREAPPHGQLEAGVLYHSPELGFIQHLCACGCGLEVHVSTYGVCDNWALIRGERGPSVEGSFSDRFHCKSHYSIVDGGTVWHA